MLSIHSTMKLDRLQLAQIDVTPRGHRSSRWKGVQHAELANTIIDRAVKKGYRVADDMWSINVNGSDLYGVVKFGWVGWLPDGMGLALGVKHSNAGRFAVSFIVGANVFVCDNGMMSGGFIVKRRHTTGLDLSSAIDQGLDRFFLESQSMRAVISNMQERMITNQEASLIIIKAASEGIIPWRGTQDVWNQWLMPSHDDFKDRSLWSLYNSFTQEFKDYAPARQLRSLTLLKTRFDKEVALRS